MTGLARRAHGSSPHPVVTQDALALASEVGLTIGAISDPGELLSSIAQRVAEALDVWQCDICEYRPDTRSLVAAAVWAREMGERERGRLGTRHDLDEWPGYRRLIVDRAPCEVHRDDDDLSPAEAASMDERGERSRLSVPLVFGGAVIGALTLVEKRAVRRLGPGDRRLVELLAVPAAVAVHSGRMLRREAEQDRRLSALATASAAMASTLDLDELLATIAEAAGQALDAAECAIDIYDEAEDSIVIKAYYQRDPLEDPAEWIGRSYSLADYPRDRVTLRSGVITEEHVSDPDLDEANRRSMLDDGEQTHLTVPLVHEGRAIGLLVFVELGEERHFTDEERQVALALSEQATAAIHNARLLLHSNEQNRRLDLLLRSMRAISSSMDLEDVLDTVARTAGELLGAEQCQIQDYDSGANTVTPVAFWQRHAERPEPGSLNKVYSLDDEPDERAFLEAKTAVQQLRSDPSLAQPTRDVMDKYGDLSYLNIPLVFNEQSFGVMVLVETEYERRWSDEDVALGTALAEQAAVAIENARLYRRVQGQALTDGLTGLYNHRYFYERLEQEVARARRYGTPVSLLMIDLDDFKAFNDRRGHPAGDAVLRAIAEVLRSELRHNLDIAARYGGEEFAVILPNTPMQPVGDGQMEMDLSGHGGGEADPPAPGHRDGAESVAERIRRRVAAAEFPSGDHRRPSRLTVSVGVAVFPLRTESPEDLVANADAALYKAKRSGKNRVESYG